MRVLKNRSLRMVCVCMCVYNIYYIYMYVCICICKCVCVCVCVCVCIGMEDCSWMRSDPAMEDAWFKCKNSTPLLIIVFSCVFSLSWKMRGSSVRTLRLSLLLCSLVCSLCHGRCVVQV